MICVRYIIIFLSSYLFHFACHKLPVVYLLHFFFLITSNLSPLILLYMHQPPLFQKPQDLSKYAVFPQFVLSFEIIPSVSDLKKQVCLPQRLFNYSINWSKKILTLLSNLICLSSNPHSIKTTFIFKLVSNVNFTKNVFLWFTFEAAL